MRFTSFLSGRIPLRVFRPTPVSQEVRASGKAKEIVLDKADQSSIEKWMRLDPVLAELRTTLCEPKLVALRRQCNRGYVRSEVPTIKQ